MISSKHVYEIRPRKDHRGIDLISDALPFGRLWYGEPNAINNAIGYARFFSRSHGAVIHVYDEAAEGSERFQRPPAFTFRDGALAIINSRYSVVKVLSLP
jgi:hypothetical protein